MIIYLDTCCYGRPYDEPTQLRIVTEAAATMAVIELCRLAGHYIIGSPAVFFELEDIPNAKKRADIETFFDVSIDTYAPITDDDDARAQALEAEGLGAMDSLHLAVAEAMGADVLLTTDDIFIKACAKKQLSSVRVINPLNFLPEVII